MEHILTILLLVPIVGAVVTAALPKDSARPFGIAVGAIELVLSLIALYYFDSSTGKFQFIELYPIIPDYGMNYFVAVDGFSIYLMILAIFVTLICLVGIEQLKHMEKMIVTLLLMEATMIGFFISLDAILFYILFEVSLVPMLYIIGAWGGEKRIYASMKFFIYTFSGSMIMLVGILYLGVKFHEATGVWSFSMLDWYFLVLPFDIQFWLFLAFYAGFAVKMPIFPFHTWLPHAHGQAPTVGSVILAAVLLKMGASYGFLRFSFPIMPDASIYFMPVMAAFSLIMVIYGSLLAFAQSDIKQVIAYSSIAHMGVVMLGLFSMNVEGFTGSVFLMFSHGIVSGGLFLLVGVIYERMHTKDMSQFGGIAKVMPKYALLFAIFTMANVSLPLTIGFVGEFLCLVGYYKTSPWMTAAAGLLIITSAVYMLNIMRRTFYGPIINEKVAALKDLNKRELLAIVPLAALVIILGVYPKPILQAAESSSTNLLAWMLKKASPENKLIIMQANIPNNQGAEK
ncbi:MAG: hypothetical protein RL154_1565 [Pseudomonadota bacterium]|jgi:NADH-quinone oxidoreductase subunit M